MLLDSYQNHPEAKSLGPDGQSCEFDTRGLLQRAHVVANWPPIYIGKESDRHWEEGEDLSLLEFKTIQYRRRGNAVADDEQLVRIAKVPKREFTQSYESASTVGIRTAGRHSINYRTMITVVPPCPDFISNFPCTRRHESRAGVARHPRRRGGEQ
jgi:hypothetical protein